MEGRGNIPIGDCRVLKQRTCTQHRHPDAAVRVTFYKQILLDRLKTAGSCTPRSDGVSSSHLTQQTEWRRVSLPLLRLPISRPHVLSSLNMFYGVPSPRTAPAFPS